MEHTVLSTCFVVSPVMKERFETSMTPITVRIEASIGMTPNPSWRRQWASNVTKTVLLKWNLPSPSRLKSIVRQLRGVQSKLSSTKMKKKINYLSLTQF
jgi:hypothetical protein